MEHNNVSKRRILVVEDEPIISRVCMKTLTAEGYEVAVAVNGLVAKNMVSDNKYDLCLVDVRTPEMNGIELYHWLEEEHPELLDKVIFATGDVLSGNVATFLKDSGARYLAKPFTPSELKATVREAFE
ncbi:response regulator [Chloroflexota bacterium]